MSKTITINAIILFSLAAILIQNVQAYPINVTDDFGYKMTITNVTRIVSLAPSNTEILFAVGASSRVVGVTDYCDYPPEVLNISSIGGFANVNIEAVVNLNPDLVLAAYGNGEQTIDQLRNLNLTVVALNPENTEDIIKNILLVGNITENDDNASLIAANMRQEIKDITDATTDISENQKAKVLYIVWDAPLYAAGDDTYADDLIKKAGGINIAKSSGWPVMGLESVIAQNPQIIITSGMGTGASEALRGRIMNNTVLAQTDAVRANRVYAVADPNVIERAGPRITQGLKELVETFSSFAITESKDADSPRAVQTEVQAEVTVTPTLIIPAETTAFPAPASTPKSPGFGYTLAVVALLVVFRKWRL
jgi:iron complex transport system substrate-binding protein